jgi:hypothetical protein
LGQGEKDPRFECQLQDCVLDRVGEECQADDQQEICNTNKQPMHQRLLGKKSKIVKYLWSFVTKNNSDHLACCVPFDGPNFERVRSFINAEGLDFTTRNTHPVPTASGPLHAISRDRFDFGRSPV